jgi:hypothetical protein
MGKLTASVILSNFEMQQFYPAWIAIAVSAIAIAYSRPVLAQSQPQTKLVASQSNRHQSVSRHLSIHESALFFQAQLARELILQPKSSATQPPLRSKVNKSNTPVSVKSKITRSTRSNSRIRQIKDETIDRGIDSFIEIDRQLGKNIDFSAVNNLTD